MNDQRSIERFLSERFDDVGPGRRMPDEALDSLLARARETRQPPRWLALIKEPPMRTDSHLAVGSPTARVAAIVVATLLLVAVVAGAGIAGARLLAADATIVVAQDGSGDYATITEAVEAADDGDTVLVRPGTYVEAVVIEEDITLSGDGPTEEIIMEAPEGGPTAPSGADRGFRPAAYALLLRDTEAVISGLTFRGEQSRVHASGGSPLLDGLVLDGVDKPHVDYSDLGGVLVTDGSRATVRDSLFEGGNGVLVYDGAEPLITGSVLRSGASIGGRLGDGGVIRGNEISGAPFAAIGLHTPTAVLVEDNAISDAPTGIYVDPSYDEGVDPRIRSNRISGCVTGIGVGLGTAPTIEANTLAANQFGISLSDGARTAVITGNGFKDNQVAIGIGRTDARVEGNTFEGGAAGVVLTSGATAAITDNTVEGASRYGISISGGATPTLTGNRICDNGINLEVAEGANPILDGNDICPDPPASPEA